MARPEPSPAAQAALKALAELGAGKAFVPTSSGALAERLGVSQQTASRKILELTELGLVQRRVGARGQQLRLSPAGVEALRREFASLRAALEPGAETLEVTGKVATGLGEGRWYMSRRGYRDAMQRLLGFAPFPGTLNLALEGPEVAKLSELGAHEGLVVGEFQDEGRTFGAVKCFPAQLRGVDAAAILPVRGHYRDVLEVIAPLDLREEFGLQDGDEVRVEVRLG